jgi:hypothetical protein
MEEKIKLDIEGFSTIYKELADIIGVENTYKIYQCMRGQQITLPKHLYSTDYVIKKIQMAENSKEIKRIAVECDYTEKYLKYLQKKSINDS